MTTTTDRRAILFAAFTMFAWGSAGAFVRLIAARFTGVSTIIPLAILGGRFLGAFIALLLTVLACTPHDVRHKMLPALQRAETWIAAAFQFTYYLLAVIGFMFAPVGEIALCASTAPLWVLLIRRLRGQTITGGEMIGAAVALSGVALIVLPNLLKHRIIGASDPFPHREIGDALSLASAAVTGVYALLQRRFVAQGVSVEPRALALSTFLIGLPLIVFLKPIPSPLLYNLPTLTLFAGFAVFTTVLPTLAFAIAARRLQPVTTATVALLLPVFATVYAAIFLKETPPGTLIPGGVLVLFGLWTLTRPHPKLPAMAGSPPL